MPFSFINTVASWMLKKRKQQLESSENKKINVIIKDLEIDIQ